jgi:guanosine-3',5'-bis(diphosphate) 3'-pyrophosphohydrolase
VIREIERALMKLFQDRGLKAQVFGREKRPYSIWRKMERKNLSLDQLSDIFGFRSSLIRWMTATGAGHDAPAWRAVPGRFKDYISTPKQNDYRSLHTTVVGPHHMRVEMQIRTRIMHEIAERGVAAHALYKDTAEVKVAETGAREGAAESNAYRWLRHLMEVLQEGDSPKEFLEHTQARTVPRPGVLLHAQGPAHRPAARRHAHRLRLCRAHLDRRQLCRLPHQRPPRAAGDNAEQRR